MANRTVSDAQSVKGTNPQFLIEKIIRSRIYESRYWKEECFALTAELIVDKAISLTCVGGVHGACVKPTPFLCLLLKLLQIQPEKDIIVEFIRQENYKYVRALGAMYMRMIGTSLDCYKYLEPLYNDYRKIKMQTRQSTFDIIHFDEFIDKLLNEDRVCDVILPRIQRRDILEEAINLDIRVSALDDDLDEPNSDEKKTHVRSKRSNTRSATEKQAKVNKTKKIVGHKQSHSSLYRKKSSKYETKVHEKYDYRYRSSSQERSYSKLHEKSRYRSHHY